MMQGRLTLCLVAVVVMMMMTLPDTTESMIAGIPMGIDVQGRTVKRDPNSKCQVTTYS